MQTTKVSYSNIKRHLTRTFLSEQCLLKWYYMLAKVVCCVPFESPQVEEKKYISPIAPGDEGMEISDVYCITMWTRGKALCAAAVMHAGEGRQVISEHRTTWTINDSNRETETEDRPLLRYHIKRQNILYRLYQTVRKFSLLNIRAESKNCQECFLTSVVWRCLGDRENCKYSYSRGTEGELHATVPSVWLMSWTAEL